MHCARLPNGRARPWEGGVCQIESGGDPAPERGALQIEAPGEDHLCQNIEIPLGAGASEENAEGSCLVEEEENPVAPNSSRELLDGCQDRKQLQSVYLRLTGLQEVDHVGRRCARSPNAVVDWERNAPKPPTTFGI